MDNFSPISSLLLGLMALTAFATLITVRRTINALLLFGESLLLLGYYLIRDGFSSITSLNLILCLLCLIILSATMYLEKTFHVMTPSRSTFSIVMGGLFFIFFAFILEHLKGVPRIPDVEFHLEENSLKIFAVLFIFLSIIISANAILSTKRDD